MAEGEHSKLLGMEGCNMIIKTSCEQMQTNITMSKHIRTHYATWVGMTKPLDQSSVLETLKHVCTYVHMHQYWPAGGDVVGMWGFGSDFFSQPKVSNLDLLWSIAQKVLWLEITVEEAMPVHVGQSL